MCPGLFSTTECSKEKWKDLCATGGEAQPRGCCSHTWPGQGWAYTTAQGGSGALLSQAQQVCPDTSILPWEMLMVEMPSKSTESTQSPRSDLCSWLFSTTLSSWPPQVVPKISFHVSLGPDKLGMGQHRKGAVELAPEPTFPPSWSLCHLLYHSEGPEGTEQTQLLNSKAKGWNRDKILSGTGEQQQSSGLLQELQGAGAGSGGAQAGT